MKPNDRVTFTHDTGPVTGTVLSVCGDGGANSEHDMNLPPQMLGMTYGTPLDTLEWPKEHGQMPGFWYGRDDKGIVVKCFRSGDGAHG